MPELDDESATLVRREFPVLLSTWYGPVAEGYFAAALESAGAEKVHAGASIKATATGTSGLELGDFELRASWS
jgi:hypothetical protein